MLQQVLQHRAKYDAFDARHSLVVVLNVLRPPGRSAGFLELS